MTLDKQSESVLRKLREAAKQYDVDKVHLLAIDLAESLETNSLHDPTTFFLVLQRATHEYNRPRVEELCVNFIELIKKQEVMPNQTQALKIVEHLRAKRYFEPLAALADALIFRGKRISKLRRLYAQALIEQGRYSSAERTLNDLIGELPEKNPEYKEACGLLGRLHKQNYIDGPGKPNKRSIDHLQTAVNAYNDVYQADKASLWHGINLVALQVRAEKDKVYLGELPDLKRSAGQILNKIKAKTRPREWDLATAAAACLALERDAEALEWVVRYSQDSRVDAFEIASTLRQFREVWQLSPDKQTEAKILHVLQTELLEREGGEINLQTSETNSRQLHRLEQDKEFEKVLGKDGYVSFKWYVTGIERAQAVAIIRNQFDEGVGTGFLVRGSDIKLEWGDDLILITNEHVVSHLNENRSSGALQPENAHIAFEFSTGTPREYKIQEIIWSSPAQELDACIFRLDMAAPVIKPYAFAKRLPVADGKQRVYVIGHPKGGKLSLSIHDNTLLGHKDSLVHYRAPTEGGSSGSPVFNSQWELIALHHAGGFKVPKLDGSGVYPANEGIWVQSIIQAVNS